MIWDSHLSNNVYFQFHFSYLIYFINLLMFMPISVCFVDLLMFLSSLNVCCSFMKFLSHH